MKTPKHKLIQRRLNAALNKKKAILKKWREEKVIYSLQDSISLEIAVMEECLRTVKEVNEA